MLHWADDDPAARDPAARAGGARAAARPPRVDTGGGGGGGGGGREDAGHDDTTALHEAAEAASHAGSDSEDDECELVFRTPSATDLASEDAAARRSSHLKRRLSLVSDDTDGPGAASASQVFFLHESSLTPRSVSSLSLQDLESPRTSGSSSPTSGGNNTVHKVHQVPSGGLAVSTSASLSSSASAVASGAAERKFTIGGGIAMSSQRLSNLGALSPIQSSRGVGRVMRGPTLVVVCGAVFAALLIGTLVVLFRSKDLWASQTSGPSFSPGDFVFKHQRLVTILFVSSASLGVVLGASYVAKRRRLAEERVLLAHGDEILSNVVAKARAEWQAGRFANQRNPNSPHFEPTSSQRRWAHELLSAST